MRLWANTFQRERWVGRGDFECHQEGIVDITPSSTIELASALACCIIVIIVVIIVGGVLSFTTITTSTLERTQERILDLALPAIPDCSSGNGILREFIPNKWR
jgi:hypothetical protein